MRGKGFTRAGDPWPRWLEDARDMVSERTEVPVPRWAMRAAYASALSATIGFIPLHAVWALGIPLWADEGKCWTFGAFMKAVATRYRRC